MKAIKINDVIVPYEVVCGKSKSLSMKYDAKNQKLIVLANRWTSSAKIEEFIKNKREWIIKQISKPWKFVHIGRTIDVFGKNYPVRVILSNKNEVVLNEECVVYVTEKVSNEEIEKRLKQFLKDKLSKFVVHIQPKVEEVAKVNGVKFRFRYMTSRFGVCYPKKKEITLNAFLACFSKQAICAVLFHEYAHFYQANHSKKYYDVLNELYPSYQQDMLELKYVILK